MERSMGYEPDNRIEGTNLRGRSALGLCAELLQSVAHLSDVLRDAASGEEELAQRAEAPPCGRGEEGALRVGEQRLDCVGVALAEVL